MQLLFQQDLNPGINRAVCESFARDRLKDPASRAFCLQLLDGVKEHLEEIDKKLAEAAENWRLPRMAVVDRNVLRMGAYELLYTPATPVAAVLDEAIELARRYGTANSPAFVNGVLDKLKPGGGAAAPIEGQPPAAPNDERGMMNEIQRE